MYLYMFKYIYIYLFIIYNNFHKKKRSNSKTDQGFFAIFLKGTLNTFAKAQRYLEKATAVGHTWGARGRLCEK